MHVPALAEAIILYLLLFQSAITQIDTKEKYLIVGIKLPENYTHTHPQSHTSRNSFYNICWLFN